LLIDYIQKHKMINKITTLLLSLSIFSNFSAQEKLLYFDNSWKETTKKNAVFYRPLPLLKSQNVELLRDFYIKNNVMQMQGYYADGDMKNYVGEIFWYNENGDDSSQDIYLNKSKQKKLSYYFDDGKLWKTVEYGDSLKHGKTIEYKPDGSILGESTFKNGYLISGIVGQTYNLSQDYTLYNIKTKSNEHVYLPTYKGEDRIYKKIFYWKSNLKTAAEFTFKNSEVIETKDYDQSGNLVQTLNSDSYYQNSGKLKNGKVFYYKVQKSAIAEAPTFTEFRSYPFSDVKLGFISYLILYRGTIHFLEKHPDKDQYRLIEYEFFKENKDSKMRLELNPHWEPLNEFIDQEALLIPVSEIESLSKTKIFEKLSKKTWSNKDLKNKPITETLYFSSSNFMGKILKSSTKTETNEKESALIYLNIVPEKYILLRENGGYFIPKKSGEILEIPNFFLN